MLLKNKSFNYIEIMILNIIEEYYFEYDWKILFGIWLKNIIFNIMIICNFKFYWKLLFRILLEYII